jgi:hypothetical protein
MLADLQDPRDSVPPDAAASAASAQIIAFPRRPAAAGGADAPPVEPTLARYERRGEDDDYRHRMLVNVAAFAVCVALVVTGIWLATKVAELRRDQDCVLAGRTNCAQISSVSGWR